MGRTQSRVHAGEVGSRWRVHQLQEASPGRGPIAPIAEQLALQEEQLGVIGIACLPGPTEGERIRPLPQLAVPLGQQGIQLADNGIARLRAFQLRRK